MMNLFNSCLEGIAQISPHILGKFLLICTFCDNILAYVALIVFFPFVVNRNKEICSNFKKQFDSLPAKKKIWIMSFTLYFAIPNRIYVYSQPSAVFIGLIIFFLTSLTLVFQSSLILFIFSILGFTVQSFVISQCYKKIPFFRNTVNDKLFDNNLEFSKNYFDFFYGNMDKGSKTIIGYLSAVFGGAFSSVGIYLGELVAIDNIAQLETTLQLAERRDNGETILPGESVETHRANVNSLVSEYGLFTRFLNLRGSSITTPSKTPDVNNFDLPCTTKSEQDSKSQAVLNQANDSEISANKCIPISNDMLGLPNQIKNNSVPKCESADLGIEEASKPKATSPAESVFDIESMIFESFKNILNLISNMEVNLHGVPIISMCLKSITIVWFFKSFFYFKIQNLLSKIR